MSSLFSGEGSIEQRKYRLKQLQSLSPTARMVDVANMTRGAFETVEAQALKEARSNAHNCGRLFASSSRDDGGRKITTFEGDPAVWMAPYMSPGYSATINKNAGTHEETIRVRNGQRVVVA